MNKPVETGDADRFLTSDPRIRAKPQPTCAVQTGQRPRFLLAASANTGTSFTYPPQHEYETEVQRAIRRGPVSRALHRVGTLVGALGLAAVLSRSPLARAQTPSYEWVIPQVANGGEGKGNILTTL